MKHSNNICEDEKSKNFSFVVINEVEKCLPIADPNNVNQLSKYLLKVGSASAITLSICNIGYNSANFHYSESITVQETKKFGINYFLINTPITDNISLDHEIAYKSTELENLNPIPPKNSIKVKGRIINITKGFITRV